MYQTINQFKKEINLNLTKKGELAMNAKQKAEI